MATIDSIARREPLYGQRDLRYLKDMLERMLAGRKAIKGFPRSLTTGELEFLARCESLSELVREDYTGALNLDRPRAHGNGKRPVAAHVQLRLGEGDGS